LLGLRLKHAQYRGIFLVFRSLAGPMKYSVSVQLVICSSTPWAIKKERTYFYFELRQKSTASNAVFTVRFKNSM